MAYSIENQAAPKERQIENPTSHKERWGFLSDRCIPVREAARWRRASLGFITSLYIAAATPSFMNKRLEL
jgi:hypothetical protein